MQLLYLAGPYRGDVKANVQRAAQVAARLWRAGYAVICPHLNTGGLAGYAWLPWDDWLRGDLIMLARCDAIVMLPGWQRSQGARAELACARRHGLAAYRWTGDRLEPLDDAGQHEPR